MWPPGKKKQRCGLQQEILSSGLQLIKGGKVRDAVVGSFTFTERLEILTSYERDLVP